MVYNLLSNKNRNFKNERKFGKKEKKSVIVYLFLSLIIAKLIAIAIPETPTTIKTVADN